MSREDSTHVFTAMPGYVNIPSTRGGSRLEYIPEEEESTDGDATPQHSTQTGSHNILTVPGISAGIQPPPFEKKKKIPKPSRLASHKENAKRFLKLVSSSRSSSSAPPEDARPQFYPAFDLNSQFMHENEQTPGTMPFVENITHHQRNGLTSSASCLSGHHRRSSIPSVIDTLRPSSARRSRSASKSDFSIPLINEKPVASGNGIFVTIALAESVLYLQGFDHTDADERPTTMLRGSLHLRIMKSAKIKAISLKFRGRAETEWPEGIPPQKSEFRDVETIMNHTWPFFNAQFPQAENSHGADHVQLVKSSSSGTDVSELDMGHPINSHLSPRDAKRLSLQLSQTRSFEKGDSPRRTSSVAQKGYKIFHPGDYIYNFELPLDTRIPETINVELGRVKYELEAVVERAGAFKANLVGSKEVILIRAPAEGSLEQVEPIAISRCWEDQLHYEIVISGKSFPIGSQIPIAFKLTPLAKVQCHRIKVFVTENIEYFTKNKRVHRMEPIKTIQLLEKCADSPSVSNYPGGTLRVTAGGGNGEAGASGDEVIDRRSANLLGDLENEQVVGPTEMEMMVQLPSCPKMKEKEKSQRMHFDTTYQYIQVHHWIKIAMRLSRPDTENPSKRRHFEISIDSPFHILSCRATQANTCLPAYASQDHPPYVTADEYECGCPGAAISRRGSNVTSATQPLPFPFPVQLNGSTSVPAFVATTPTAPAVAHLPSDNTLSSQCRIARPMHLIRTPSFNPPAFSEASLDPPPPPPTPPPPLPTPPPDYDSITDSGGLADYFVRLMDDIGNDSDESSELSMRLRSDIGLTPPRIDVPLLPGGRVNRSMDERRSWQSIGRFE